MSIMNKSYRRDVEWEIVSGIDIEDSDNEKGYVPAEIAKDALDNIENDIKEIQFILRNVEGLGLIDDVKKKLEDLYEKIY